MRAKIYESDEQQRDAGIKSLQMECGGCSNRNDNPAVTLMQTV